MQFMPRTWTDVAKQPLVARYDPALSIWFGARYQCGLRRSFENGIRTAPEAQDFGLGSYNAGMGNIRKAAVNCRDPRKWDDLVACLPGITGKHADETIGYIVRNRNVFKALQLGE